MTTCRFCGDPLVWVPTSIGYRPFEPPGSLDPETPVVVMRRHVCPDMDKYRAEARKAYAVDLVRDPVIRKAAMGLTCPKCGVEADVACNDLRSKTGRKNNTPHLERITAGAESLQQP